jgi:hypothetical protein
MIDHKKIFFPLSRLGRWLSVAAALSIGPMGPASAQEGAQSQFVSFAEELLAGIGSASVEDIPAIGGYGKPRIAVTPFKNTEKTVPPQVASEYNTRLLAELTRQGSGTYRFVARETLSEIIRELDTIEELEAPNNRRVVDLLRNARVDILIVGALRKTGETVTISYKAVSVEDGIVFAATRPRQIWLTQPSAVARRELPRLPPGRLANGGRRPVFRAQQMLAGLGYDPGPRDGLMRPLLRRAIRGYQYDFGQVATGRMTRRLIHELRASLREQRKTALALP